jgi:group I intron endonuclease
MKNLVYKVTNTKTGKVYIGQTTQGLVQRKREHVARFNLGERDHLLYKSMRKHGLESFIFEPLQYAQKEELDALEVQYIEKYNSYFRGYNMTSGGDNVSDETRLKIKLALTGRVITWREKINATRIANETYGKFYNILTRSGCHITIKNLERFCEINNLDVSNLHKTKTGRDCCKGYMLLKPNDYPEMEYAQVSGSGASPIL